MSAKQNLNLAQVRNIPLLLIQGYTIKMIAKKYNISVQKVVFYFEAHYTGNTYPVYLNGKHEPYYTNEDDYGKIPTYEFNSLSEAEKKIYNAI